MAYIAPVHRPSSVRHALKLNFLDPEEDCLVVAKSNRLEFYTQNVDGLSLQYSKAIYGKVTMLQKLRPALSPTDHLFVGTDRFVYFTLSWNPEKKQLRTEKTFESVADNAARESQTGERCHIDPSSRFMTVEVYEGIITVVPLVQRGKKRKQESDIAHLGEPQPCRLPEMFVRSSAFLKPRLQDKNPKLALLYEDTQSKVKLRIRELSSAGGDAIELEDGQAHKGELDLGASHLIPIESPTHGLVIVGETSIAYYNDETEELYTEPLQAATIFVAWAPIDSQRFIFADDYGRLYLFMLELDDHGQLQSWRLDVIGQTSRASVLIYLDAGHVFVGSHQGDSQLLRISKKSTEVIQTFSNIAPILDFTIMDMGNRSSEGQTNEYSSGQARIVTGSGAYQDGSLRSVRSGVGLESLGVLGEMDHISNIFSMSSDSSSEIVDVLLVTLLDESRVFRFDQEGEVEELEEFAGLSLSTSTLFAGNSAQDRIIQVTESWVRTTNIEGGMLESEWLAPKGQSITAASVNDTHVLVSLGGVIVVTIDIDSGLSVVRQKKFGADDQIACVALPFRSNGTCFLGSWNSAQLLLCSISDLSVISSIILSEDSVPRSLLLAQIFPNQSPTLFAAMADGSVVTYSFDPSTNHLSGKKSIILGTREATFRALPRQNGLYNVIAICEHPSLIYSSEGRLVYSAVTAEKATAVCPFDTYAYPGAVAIATTDDLRIALVDTERTTHVQTLKVDETVRRICYSPFTKAFGLGTIKRILRSGEEILRSHFKLVDEIQFKELDTWPLKEDELVESVMRCDLPTGPDPHDVAERFVVGTTYLDDQNAVAERGRILVLEVTRDRQLKLVTELAVKGGCRCLAICEGKIVAALIKTVVLFNLEYRTEGTFFLEKLASFRCSTAPTDVIVNGPFISVADLMKSLVVLQFVQGDKGLPSKLIEVARHYQTAWTTAVAEVDGNTYLQADAEGNIQMLFKDENGVTDDDKRRLNVVAEMLLGEMVNKIRRIDVATAPDAAVIPRAFLATVEGSIYMFGLISPSYQNLLMTLQSNLAELVRAPGDVPFTKYRAFKSQVRQSEEPFRFVDGELVERFSDISEDLQRKAVDGLGVDVEEVRGLVETLRRLH